MHIADSNKIHLSVVKPKTTLKKRISQHNWVKYFDSIFTAVAVSVDKFLSKSGI